MDKLRRKPSAMPAANIRGRFDRFHLSENPFPSEPVVNKDSTDKRINGGIYEVALREPEFSKLRDNFLVPSTALPAHLRLGYIVDKSYIGRGNGKSAFLVHLQQQINKEWCLDLSAGVNKCFALYVTPQPGGRTKTFPAFVDALVESVFTSHIIRDSLAAIRLNAIAECYSDHPLLSEGNLNRDELIDGLENTEWCTKQGIDLGRIRERMRLNSYLTELPADFPLFTEIGRHSIFADAVTEDDFVRHYSLLRKPRERLTFAFSHLVRLFQAADFTGSFVLVDDFERVPDFQGVRQRKDFALELRAALYDGPYYNAVVGFYTVLLVLHAGVPALISEAWAEAGMEHRAPLGQDGANHSVSFEKLSNDHVRLLLRRYLSEYRIAGAADTIEPFTIDAVDRIGQMSEFNAAKILQMAYSLLERAADAGQSCIDGPFVDSYREILGRGEEKTAPAAIEKALTTDLVKKAEGSSKE